MVVEPLDSSQESMCDLTLRLLTVLTTSYFLQIQFFIVLSDVLIDK